MNYRYLLFLLVLISACKTAKVDQSKATEADANQTIAYVGTYTRSEGHVNGQAEGIYRIGIDKRTGKIGKQETVASTTNPSFLTLSADKQFLYAVSELAHADEPTGFIHAFRIEGNKLTEISKLPTNGQAPCHVEIDQTGKYAVVSNYVGGATTVYRVMDNGELRHGSTWTFDEEILDGKPSWLHSANFSPDNKIVVIADKGSDRIWLFTIDDDGSTVNLRAHPRLMIRLAEGAGPRHTQWSADGRFLYVINELSNTVNVIGYDRKRNSFTVLQTITTLPEGYTETSYCADLHLHPNGNFLYGSNRGHNSIAMYAVDKSTGLLISLGQESTRGEYPRNFSIDDRGNFLYAANQNSGNITTYQIGADGKLTFTGEDYKIATPVCIEY